MDCKFGPSPPFVRAMKSFLWEVLILCWGRLRFVFKFLPSTCYGRFGESIYSYVSIKVSTARIMKKEWYACEWEATRQSQGFPPYRSVCFLAMPCQNCVVILLFIRNMYLVIQTAKIYFSYMYGLHPQFVVHSSLNSWNFLSFESGGKKCLLLW